MIEQRVVTVADILYHRHIFIKGHAVPAAEIFGRGNKSVDIKTYRELVERTVIFHSFEGVYEVSFFIDAAVAFDVITKVKEVFAARQLLISAARYYDVRTCSGH